MDASQFSSKTGVERDLEGSSQSAGRNEKDVTKPRVDEDELKPKVEIKGEFGFKLPKIKFPSLKGSDRLRSPAANVATPEVEVGSHDANQYVKNLDVDQTTKSKDRSGFVSELPKENPPSYAEATSSDFKDGHQNTEQLVEDEEMSDEDLDVGQVKADVAARGNMKGNSANEDETRGKKINSGFQFGFPKFKSKKIGVKGAGGADSSISRGKGEFGIKMPGFHLPKFHKKEKNGVGAVASSSNVDLKGQDVDLPDVKTRGELCTDVDINGPSVDVPSFRGKGGFGIKLPGFHLPKFGKN